jgi:hypothetical protein
MALNAIRLHHFLNRPALSPNSLHSSEYSLLPSFHVVRRSHHKFIVAFSMLIAVYLGYESLEIRRPIFEP